MFYLFHPLLIFGWLMVLSVWSDPYRYGGSDLQHLLPLMALILFSTAVIPAVGGGMMKVLDLIKDMRMIELRDRIIPLTATAVFYTAFYTNVGQVTDLAPQAQQLMLGILITLFILMFLSPFYQPSIHSSGMATLLIGLFVIFYSGSRPFVAWHTTSLNIYIYATPLVVLAMVSSGYLGSWLIRYRGMDTYQVLSGWMLGAVGQAVAMMWYTA